MTFSIEQLLKLLEEPHASALFQCRMSNLKCSYNLIGLNLKHWNLTGATLVIILFHPIYFALTQSVIIPTFIFVVSGKIKKFNLEESKESVCLRKSKENPATVEIGSFNSITAEQKLRFCSTYNFLLFNICICKTV